MRGVAFHFRNFKDECQILKKFEAMNHMTDCVYIIHTLEDEGGLENRCHLQALGEVGCNNFAAELQIKSRVDEAIQ